jgi:ATP-dependent RNA circularization protein (DNA/RNA ligase family)
LKYENITEEDISGILISEFPDNVSLDESRDRLEMLVAEVYYEDNEGFSEAEKPEMSLSPYTVFRALARKAEKETSKLRKSNYRAFKEAARDAMVSRSARLAFSELEASETILPESGW